MIGLLLGETKLGELIIKKLNFLEKEFLIIDISKKKIFKNKKNSFSLSIGQLGKAISILKRYRCKKVIFAGKVSRPNFTKAKFDFKALYYLPKIISESKKGDASLLKVIIKIFEKEGFKVLSSTYYNSELVLKKGNYTKIKPNRLNKMDILKGKNIITKLEKNYAGQGIVINDGHVIAIEGLAGTNNMLNNARSLLKKFYNKNNKKGILLKFPKKNQDLRVDLPTVGVKTISKCASIGLQGVVVKSNQNIFIDKRKCVNLANKKKMFITSV